MVLGHGDFGMCLGHKSGALLSMIPAYIKDSRELRNPFRPPCETHLEGAGY